MEIIKGLKYSKDHEWVRVEGNKAYIGLSNYAQLSMGDIVFVELTQLDTQLSAGDILCAVESVKAASDIYTPVSGVVTQVNEELNDSPEKINEEPYINWIAVIRMSKPEELDGLMDEETYGKFCVEGD